MESFAFKKKVIVETVGADHAHHGLNAGDGQRPRVEPDLGLAVWRRHINPGLIPHTQSSRIWRQASQVGQVPLMRHITERLGTGNGSVSRMWDSLPFVMVRRMPMIQARTIPSVGSTADRKNQSELHGLAGTPRSEPDGSLAIALDSKGLDGHATASPIGIQREARAAVSERHPLVQRTLTDVHGRQQDGMPDMTSVFGSSQGSELSTASPMSIQRESQSGMLEHLQLVRHSAAETHDRHQGGEPEVISNSGPSQSPEPFTASPVNIQREAPPVMSDHLPLVQSSLANLHDRHQGGMPEATGFHGPSQAAELSTVSPMSIQRKTESATSELLPLVQRSAAGTHESHQDGVSDAAGLLSESPISQATPEVFSPISSLSMDAAPSSPIVRRVNRSSAGSVSTGDTTMPTVTRRSGSSMSPEVFVTEGVTQGLSSITGPDLTLLRHSLAKEAGATSSLVLEAPIVRRTLRRDVPTVSDQSGTDVRPEGPVSEQVSGYGASTSGFPFVQPLSLVQDHPGGAVANDDPGIVHSSYQTSILRMRQTGTLDTQPMSTSFVRHESSATVPIILRNVRPTIHRTSDVESAHEPVWNGIQRQIDSHVAAKGVVSSPSPLLPLIQRAERPLTSSDLPTLIWRSPISGVSTGVPSLDGFADYQPHSGSVSHNFTPFIARQSTHSPESHMPRSGIPSLHEQPALAGIQEASTSVNHAEVAEQVSRLLTRQFAVERERRGVCS